MNGPWEVEKKFHVDDGIALRENLSKLGFSQRETEQHEDSYFRHPCRDLRATDEAFRIRLVNATACVTYKGPRLKNKADVKTRTEIELSIDEGEHEQWRLLLQHLGFTTVPTVRKKREIYRSSAELWRDVVVALDSVEQLGEFAEVELLVTHEAELENAQTRISELGTQLGLLRVQPRSYLSQLLAKLGVEA